MLRPSAHGVLPARPAILPGTPENLRTVAETQENPTMDVLSDALRVIRLKGALFLNAEFGEPWCVAAPSASEFAPLLSPSHPHMAICHLVVEGRCWAQLPGEAAVPLEAGDVVALPNGDAHLVGSGINHAPVAAKDAVRLKLPELARARYGGSGAQTVVICGWFGYEHQIASPVMAALPLLFRTSIRSRPSGAWLEQSIRYAVEEAGAGRAGYDAVADKLAEVLFLETLRGYIEALPEQRTGWLAGLRDPLVGASIAKLHEDPARAWTVASLAQSVNASRTVLADRFAALIGKPPMQYLTQWRMALAAHLLRSTRLSLTRVVEQVGYQSEAAFSRAFKREYGGPPGLWRRQEGASDRSATGAGAPGNPGAGA
jgi:AraC-like DNA-binding protein